MLRLARGLRDEELDAAWLPITEGDPIRLERRVGPEDRDELRFVGIDFHHIPSERIPLRSTSPFKVQF